MFFSKEVSFFLTDEYVNLFVDDVGASHELLKELGVFLIPSLFFIDFTAGDASERFMGTTVK